MTNLLFEIYFKIFKLSGLNTIAVCSLINSGV